MKNNTLTILLVFLTATTVHGIDKPRSESDQPEPHFVAECPDNATDASQCEVDAHTYTGWRTYKIECQQCHGGGGLGSTFAPNLIDRLTREGVDYGRFLYVMDNGFTGRIGVMPSLAKNPRVQKNKAAIYAYLKARAADKLPNGRPPKP